MGGLLRGAVAAWRALDHLDVVWALGPNPMSIVIATMGLLRGKRVVLGVRQDSRAYVRRRHPGRRVFWLAADLMQGAFRTLARRCPVAVVGADLARQFPAQASWRSSTSRSSPRPTSGRTTRRDEARSRAAS